ncbi:ML1 [Symbiodinium natans]|uniref:ML1 protein n=1 Tax=Symbiodinium natans TaxID=878477 RepID=A0A812U6F2_9DINO|nr:ML1 [Symbiodinium natans]
MQNMQGQGMLLSNLQLGSQNSQWQQSNLQQAQQSQPTGFPGMMQAGPCPQTILTPVQGAVQLIGMPTAMQAMPSMQMCVPVNCQNVPNVPNMIVGNQEWNQWQQHVDQAPPAGGCVTTVKNTFLHAEEQQAAMARRRESSEPPRPRSMEGFEDSDDELGNYHMEGHDVRQFSEPPHTNGQYLVIPSQNSLKSAGRAQMANVSISMEQQLQQMNGKHQAEQQQLLAHQQMEQQKFLQQYQQQRQIETMHEELQGDNTDDEDCIGQYPLLPRPATTSDGSMHWMSLGWV